MELSASITAFVTFFVIIDPVGLMPLFVAMTQGMSTPKRRSIAITAVVTATFLLTLFAFLGEAVLNFVGISMPAFRIAGGILLFLTALDMLFERRSKRRGETAGEHADDDQDDPSIFPLATPLLAGPGAIATAILLVEQADGVLGTIMVLLAMFAVLAITLIMFFSAGLFERILGPTGINVVTRLLGMLLGALAIQFILDGLKDFAPTLT
ncbi:MarC family protein [Falsihalocynthiibacter sp. SS001]|uniref:MarC family protein n=1 Tax=Falsihalocynthiibacter sp. SS001 TaxID=3349698 RepID=UPI0036D3E2C7